MRFRPDKRIMAFILLFLIGLSILLYPLISSTWNQIIQNKSIQNYDSIVESLDKETLSAMMEGAREYNGRLVPKDVPDAFSIREAVKDKEYESYLSFTDDGVMGYIEIPAIKVSSPIYHYTSEDVLQKGVGHLFGSSLPVGGKGTHSVLTAHRGLPSNKLFSDLDKLVQGDRFYIKTCGETLAYELDQIKTVLPDQTEDLAQQAGKDYVTLVTCTPYGVNTHRILCRGHRVSYVPGEEDKVMPRAWVNMNIMTALAGALLGILIALILVIRLRKRDSSEKEEDPEEKIKE